MPKMQCRIQGGIREGMVTQERKIERSKDLRSERIAENTYVLTNLFTYQLTNLRTNFLSERKLSLADSDE